MKYTGGRRNDFNVQGYTSPARLRRRTTWRRQEGGRAGHFARSFPVPVAILYVNYHALGVLWTSLA
jgi:hypothetical protein